MRPRRRRRAARSGRTTLRGPRRAAHRRGAVLRRRPATHSSGILPYQERSLGIELETEVVIVAIGDGGAAPDSRLVCGGSQTSAVRHFPPGAAFWQNSPLRTCLMDTENFGVLRRQMVAQLVAETIYVSARIGKAALGERVIKAISTVPRHEFVPVELQRYAYANTPLPIGFDKTISQPFIVALMTDLLDLRDSDVVLEIGTGLGYQAAVLAKLARKVYSVELIEELAGQARQRLSRLGYANIELKIGDGNYGWPEHAPFDKIIVTAAPHLIPPQLIHQLKAGGRMVIPAGLPDRQQLLLAP